MTDPAPSGPSRGPAASRTRRKPRGKATARRAAAAADGRTPPRRRSLPFGIGGRVAMASDEEVEQLGSINLEGLPGVGGDRHFDLDPRGRPLEADLPLAVAEDVGCAAASNLFGGMPEQGKGPTLDEPVDIPVDVIHVFARRLPGGDLRGRDGLDFNDIGHADAVVPERVGGVDGLDDTDAFVEAYMESRFRDDEEYNIDCFPS